MFTFWPKGESIWGDKHDSLGGQNATHIWAQTRLAFGPKAQSLWTPNATRLAATNELHLGPKWDSGLGDKVSRILPEKGLAFGWQTRFHFGQNTFGFVATA